MHSYNAQSQQQETHHSFDIKPLQANHPIYMASTSTERQSGGQKISQSIDFKHIGILILGKALVIALQFFMLIENSYFCLSDFKLLDFIFVTLLVSIDFWMNKNIYGKQLAGLRWWIELNEDTEEQAWIFQSADPNIEINNINNGFFWIVNLLTAAFWFINLIVIAIITTTLFWIGLCMFCFGITFINLGCFYKCRGGHQRKLQQIIEKVGLKSSTNLISKTQNMNEQSLHSGNFQIE